MKKSILAIVALLVIFCGAVYFFNKPEVDKGQSAFVNHINYFCDVGTINATYTDGHIALALSDGRSLSLPQVVSGSGIRYESTSTTDIVFSSEGANAFLTENGATTFNNCIAGTAKVSADNTLFTDSAKTFTLLYPSKFILSGAGVGYTQSWQANSTSSGLVLAQVVIPRTYAPKTNFSEAKLTIGVSSDPSALASCTSPVNGEKSAGTATINGTTFTKLIGSDAGAGNFYETTSYRTVKDGQCYAVEYTIHSTNIANYPASQGIKEFDKMQIQGILDGMLRSFTFL